MDAVAEGEVFVGGSAQAQFIGVVKDGGVSVGGADAQGEQGAGGVALATQLELTQGAAVAQLVAGFETEAFVDGSIPSCIKRGS